MGTEPGKRGARCPLYICLDWTQELWIKSCGGYYRRTYVINRRTRDYDGGTHISPVAGAAVSFAGVALRL